VIRPLRITVLGGGNGLSTVLRGLVRHANRGPGLELTAVVATADDGGSSGRLRRERGGAPVGDLRNCLLALAPGDAPLTELLGHRFGGNGSLGGHSLGNLVLSALVDRSDSLSRAVDAAARLLGVRHRVLPVTEDGVHLIGIDSDGRRIEGEANIGGASCAMREVGLRPYAPSPTPGVVEAVQAADLVVVGPGSLFTSLLPVLLVPHVPDAVRRAPRRVLVSNLMSQPGETLGLGFEAHLDAIARHVGPALVDTIVVNTGPIEAQRLDRYEDVGAEPVRVPEDWNGCGRLVGADLVTRSGKIRHDSDRLAGTLIRLAREVRPPAGAGASVGRLAGR
jgi:uncharacterized cofD-like protein